MYIEWALVLIMIVYVYRLWRRYKAEKALIDVMKNAREGSEELAELLKAATKKKP
jgi:uncharacterized protein YprB with RNaseH-like and TPR domain